MNVCVFVCVIAPAADLWPLELLAFEPLPAASLSASGWDLRRGWRKCCYHFESLVQTVVNRVPLFGYPKIDLNTVGTYRKLIRPSTGFCIYECACLHNYVSLEAEKPVRLAGIFS